MDNLTKSQKFYANKSVFEVWNGHNIYHYGAHTLEHPEVFWCGREDGNRPFVNYLNNKMWVIDRSGIHPLEETDSAQEAQLATEVLQRSMARGNDCLRWARYF